MTIKGYFTELAGFLLISESFPFDDCNSGIFILVFFFYFLCVSFLYLLSLTIILCLFLILVDSFLPFS